MAPKKTKNRKKREEKVKYGRAFRFMWLFLKPVYKNSWWPWFS